MQRVLGLDLGTASVGWAVVDVPTDETETGAILAMGSRIFAQGAEISGSTVTTTAAKRRGQRSMRRQIARRAARRRLLRSELSRIGLLPTADTEFVSLMDVDPNVLLERSQRSERLTEHEIGRLIYWMSSRRGFLSLRSGGSNVVDEDAKFTPTRFRTNQFNRSNGERVYAGQEDLLIEVLETQAQFHPKLLRAGALYGSRGRLTYPVRPIPRAKYSGATALDEFGIHGLVFFQRKVYWDQSMIGKCSLDPKSGARASRADRVAQRFSIWNTITNLKYGADLSPLNRTQKEALFAKLDGQKTLAWSQVRKICDIDAYDPINFERGEDAKSLKGNETDAALKSAIGEAAWKELAESQKDDITSVLLGEAPEDQVRSQLVAEYGFDGVAIDKLLKIAFPSGRMNYSRKTIARLLTELPAQTSLRDAITAAGYDNPEEIAAAQPLDLGTVTNPLVKKSLGQLGTVLGALEHRFARDGQPVFDVVRIELSRDVSNSSKQRDKMTKANKDNERERNDARDFITEFSPGAEQSSDTIRKVRLWKSQQGECLYCGKMISSVELLTAAIEMDHILPRSATLDNSLNNLAVVHSHENQDKRDRTIFEWRGQQGVDEISGRAKALKARGFKLKNIETEHVEGDIQPESLLVQTGYINKLARQFVAQRPMLAGKVEISRGRLTAAMLYRTGLKKDSSDHRRHAQDAVMVALTSPAMAQRLATSYKRERDYRVQRSDGYGAYEPWQGFRNEILGEYANIVVSHKASRKVRGQLHEETNYGTVNVLDADGVVVERKARRRPVAGKWNQKQLGEVADPVVRTALIANLRERGIDPTTKNFDFDAKNLPLMPIDIHGNRSKIQSVRVHLNLPGNKVLRPNDPKSSVSLNNNHGVMLTRDNSGTIKLRFINRLDSSTVRSAVLRQRFGMLGEDETFVCTLTIGETIEMDDSVTTTSQYFNVVSLAPSANRLYLSKCELVAGESKFYISSPGLTAGKVRKVVVTPDGKVRRASD